MELFHKLENILNKTKAAEFIAPLALRIYLAPILILAGSNKLANVDAVTGWFEGLGIPAPALMVWLAGLTELLGGIALLIGLAVRWFAIPLMLTMVVAAGTAHWQNGWHALPETELTVPWEWKKDHIEAALERKQKAVEILETHGNIDWLTEYGNITILKNGIEFAATYFIMLLVLFFIGSGKAGVDHYLYQRYHN
ncbi:MAG: DoxX family protein [Gammaproteobacteria bacterium]|nr:DoxX family protein [Gammaproteobacteria bacterium]MDH5651400.1 DoxX family protein [Gammaproteobacteria bacterium]